MPTTPISDTRFKPTFTLKNAKTSFLIAARYMSRKRWNRDMNRSRKLKMQISLALSRLVSRRAL